MNFQQLTGLRMTPKSMKDSAGHVNSTQTARRNRTGFHYSENGNHACSRQSLLSNRRGVKITLGSRPAGVLRVLAFHTFAQIRAAEELTLGTQISFADPENLVAGCQFSFRGPLTLITKGDRSAPASASLTPNPDRPISGGCGLVVSGSLPGAP